MNTPGLSLLDLGTQPPTIEPQTYGRLRQELFGPSLNSQSPPWLEASGPEQPHSILMSPELRQGTPPKRDSDSLDAVLDDLCLLLDTETIMTTPPPYIYTAYKPHFPPPYQATIDPLSLSDRIPIDTTNPQTPAMCMQLVVHTTGHQKDVMASLFETMKKLHSNSHVSEVSLQ